MTDAFAVAGEQHSGAADAAEMLSGSVDENDRQGGLISARDIAATTLGRDDDLSATRNAARGIVVALVIGLVLWSVLIGFGLWGWYLLSP
jgi:hypothetical protein